MIGNSLAALAGPAHTGIFRRAMQQDQQRFYRERWLSQELGSIRVAIERGELDYIPVLDQVITRLNLQQFPDQGFAVIAGQIVQLAQDRRQRLVRNTDSLLQQSPAVRARVESAFPNLLRPVGR